MAERRKPLEKIVGVIACAVLGSWMSIYWFQTAGYVKSQYTGFPLLDYWQTAVNLPRYEKFDLSLFWEQHNEHRIIFPELIYIADDLWFHAHEYLPIALT